MSEQPAGDRHEAGRGDETLSHGARDRITQRASQDAQRLSARYSATRQRVEQTTTGHHLQAIREADLMREAMILAALAFMCLVPLMITIAAISPLGSKNSLATGFVNRLGFSAAASKDVQQLFASPNAVRGASTGGGVVLGILFAYAWPNALQRGYELAWRLPPLGRSGLWRAVVWIVGFIVILMILVNFTLLVHGTLGRVLVGLISVPVVLFAAWESQHLLLGGRVGWRPLLPGAIAITIGLFGLKGAAALYFSRAIVSETHQYGPIGTVFTLLSWIVGFSVVMLGGAVVGRSVAQHRPLHP